MDFPFLFINHGSIDPDYLDKCEEVFLWFLRDVTPAERKAIEAGCPAPLACFWHWDRQFCYFGSQGDVYDATITSEYSPEHVRTALQSAHLGRDGKGFMRAWQLAEEHKGEAADAFAKDVERWAHEVHAIAPIAVLWGPNGADEEDPWSRYSTERFAEVMYDRIREYRPEGKAGKKYLGYIRNICSDLLIAPKKPRGAGKSADPADDARAVAVLDESAREHRPKRHVSRLSYPENDLLTLAGQVGSYTGKGKDAGARLSRLAPLTQLVYLASYEAGDRFSPKEVLDLVRPLLARLAEDERRSAVPLLTMMAETAVHDSPAFDRPRKKTAGFAVELLWLGASMPGYNAGSCARTSRYQRWAGDSAGALATVEEGLSRFGDRPVLLRAAIRAARALGDEARAASYAARLTAAAKPAS